MKITLFLILTMIAGSLIGQDIRGTILDTETQKPLIGATIVMKGDPSTVSDFDGHFVIRAYSGQITLSISMLGYEPQELDVKVGDTDVDLGKITLSPKTYVLLNNQVVVTAQRKEQDQFETMESVSVLSGEQIISNGSRSMAEALIGTPGVWMQKTNHGGGSPFVRGLTGNQTLLLLDGIRLNNSTYRYGPNQYFNTIDPLNVDQVEVVRGAGSVLYGSDALGGVVNVFSRTPGFTNGGWKFGGQALGRILSKDQEYTGRLRLNVANEKVAIGAGVSLRDFGDLVAGGNLGVEAPSAYGETGIDFKSLFKLSSNSILTLAYNGLFQSEVGRFDQVAQQGYQLYQFNPQNRQMAYAKMESSLGKSWLDRYKVIISYQNSLEGREKQKENSSTFAEEEDEINTLGLILEGISRLDDHWEMVTGLEYYQDKVNSHDQDTNLENGDITINRGLYPDNSRAYNFALFNSHNVGFHQWEFGVGWRLNMVSLQIEDATFGNTSISPIALVGHLSARYNLNAQQSLIANVNTGFRAPNINDLSSFGNFDFGIEVPSSDLSPERSLTYELGYKIKTRKIASNLVLYRTQLFNLISRVPGTFQGSSTYEGEDVYKKENLAKSYLQGAEFDFEWSMHRNWNLMGNIIYTYGQNTDKDEPMRRIPPLNGRLAMNYHRNRLNSQLEWLYAGQQDRLAGGDLSDHRIAAGGTPAWNVINLRLGYGFRIGNHYEFLTLNGGISNIFDEAYRIHGSGVDGMGRAAWISLSLKW